MNKNCCMLEKITDFLIRVGDHCMSCEGKAVLKESISSEKEIDITLEKELKEFKKYLKPKPKSRNVKISYLQKWIQNNNFEVFTLDQFLKSFPKQRGNNRLNSNISSLIDKKIITPFNDITNSCLPPLSGKKKFKVNR